jgi:hypothetical protein
VRTTGATDVIRRRHARPGDGRFFGAAGALRNEQIEPLAAAAAPEDVDLVGFEDLVFVTLDDTAMWTRDPQASVGERFLKIGLGQ